jgi:hypothetical protein
MTQVASSVLSSIPDTHEIRRQIAVRAAETKVLRKLLKASESRAHLLRGPNAATGYTPPEAQNAG